MCYKFLCTNRVASCIVRKYSPSRGDRNEQKLIVSTTFIFTCATEHVIYLSRVKLNIMAFDVLPRTLLSILHTYTFLNVFMGVHNNRRTLQPKDRYTKTLMVQSC